MAAFLLRCGASNMAWPHRLGGSSWALSINQLPLKRRCLPGLLRYRPRHSSAPSSMRLHPAQHPSRSRCQPLPDKLPLSRASAVHVPDGSSLCHPVAAFPLSTKLSTVNAPSQIPARVPCISSAPHWHHHCSLQTSLATIPSIICRRGAKASERCQSFRKEGLSPVRRAGKNNVPSAGGLESRLIIRLPPRFALPPPVHRPARRLCFPSSMAPDPVRKPPCDAVGTSHIIFPMPLSLAPS